MGLKLGDEGRSEEREQERRPPGRNDRDERRVQRALVPVIDQGEVPPTLVCVDAGHGGSERSSPKRRVRAYGQ